jgi:glycosyltransferase involved in cell wall biosynthesis
VRQLRRHLEEGGITSTLVTPFSWGRLLTYPVFGLRRLLIDHFSRSAGVAWYLYWHGLFLRNALRRRLAGMGECVVYAQGPLEAAAALRARRGPHQRVVMAVHFPISRADLYAHSNEIAPDGIVFRALRREERKVIPRVDRIVFVSGWAREALLSWLPEAASVPSAVIGNFIAPCRSRSAPERLGDLVTTGRLEPVKNHRFLLRVLAEAKKAGHTFTLDIFGDGALHKDLSREVTRLGLEGQVVFHGYRPDVRGFLPGYRAYVHASHLETSSLAIIEAMEAGLPVVAADVGPLSSEICGDGAEARFWPLDDPVRAASILIELLGSEPERMRASAAARERFRRDYDADVVAPRLRSFLLGDPHPAAVPSVRKARHASYARQTADVDGDRLLASGTTRDDDKDPTWMTS